MLRKRALADLALTVLTVWVLFIGTWVVVTGVASLFAVVSVGGLTASGVLAIVRYLKSESVSPFRAAKGRITAVPGTRLLALVDFLLSPKTVENIFRPLVADWRLEFFEALRQGRRAKARWISMRYRYSFVMAMSISRLVSFLRELRSAIK
jgi:hypothetical protein